jgi:hypothetical protein
LALETAVKLLSKTPNGKKSKPRTSQLKLAGIATIQTSNKANEAAISALAVGAINEEQLSLDVYVPETSQK